VVSADELPGVLERVLVRSLQRPPCLVAFSGGRDSAGVLAAASHAARRHGLPLPIPATYRFPGAAEVDESEW
jgi:asparagine synthetase B (glutamine-hydrolysing)